MTETIFRVYDAKAEFWQRPFFAMSRGAAVRAFSDIVQDPTHELGKHPGDYTLWEIGTIDSEGNGDWEIYPQAVNLGTGLNYIDQPLKAIQGGE